MAPSPEPLPAPTRGAEPTELSSPAPPMPPTANLTLRIRGSFDQRLADLVHDFRKNGIRTSKVELVEMCLAELPPQPSRDLERRLTRFQTQHRRQ